MVPHDTEPESPLFSDRFACDCYVVSRGTNANPQEGEISVKGTRLTTNLRKKQSECTLSAQISQRLFNGESQNQIQPTQKNFVAPKKVAGLWGTLASSLMISLGVKKLAVQIEIKAGG
jgi:hypothetical protein